ncbi:Beta-adaptin-like protein C [Capsicum baccatum]|uniref:Beta-adaptin-like protein C n=1 Tax=Capsicum baccatum TaxID=33114 RepID=A0A2G2VME5_CAPBA|nr:Beta-adaptin-like protein C [Capsicum baccatum]
MGITLRPDNDPYVRKTVAICVAKIYDINAELVEDRVFLDALKDLISDNNPMVVANVVAALAKIQESSSIPIFEITSHTLSKLLTALNECTEWGQGYSDSPTPVAKSGASPPASTANARHPAARQPTEPAALVLPDLLDLGMDNSNSAIGSADQPTTPSDPPLPVVLPTSSGQGLQISAQLVRRDG